MFTQALVVLVVLLQIANSSVFAQTSFYYKNWCGGTLQYLDDKYCVKAFPSNTKDMRDWSCPVPTLSSVPEGYYPEGSFKNIPVDTKTLADIVTTGANVCAVITKRVNDGSGVKPYSKYFCAGDASAYTAYETWSSSKIFTMANAAGHLRTNETTCANNVFGLDGFTTGKHGQTSLGDLATVICSYDHTAGYTSNSLSSYFHDLGWRERIHNLVGSDWIGIDGLTLGGNYGEATPSDLGFTLSSAAGDQKCSVDKDPWPTVYSNSLSTLAAAEMTRRIAMYREIDPNYRFPGTEWSDAQAELYGSSNSLLFPGQLWGGMTSDTAIFLQSSLNMTEVEARSHGNWRIFSKLGAGYSTSRYVGEIVSNAYACLPDLSGETNNNFEFSVSIRGSIASDSGLTKVEQQVLNTMKQTVTAILNGKLQ